MLSWEEIIARVGDRVRPESRSKYFPNNPLRRALIDRFFAAVAEELRQGISQARVISDMRAASVARSVLATEAARTSEVIATEAAPTRLLDLGCGEGFVDLFLSERVPGLAITGVEPDEQALSVAAALNPGAVYLAGDGRKLPFPDNSFDALVCLEVMEHLSDYPALIREAARVTSGPCVFSVPAWPFYQGANFLAGHNWSRFGEHAGHVVSFTRTKLRRDLAAVFREPRLGFSFPWLIARCNGKII